MKRVRNVVLLALCAVLLVGASVAGTLAYLTSTATVTNTFTVGNVNITLDETPVDANGKKVTNSPQPTTANSYKLVPGKDYDKNPTVHVLANSEDSWIFVKVENGISAFEATTVTGGYQNIEAQILANDWSKLTGEDNVYYKTYTSKDTQEDLVVFDNFRIADTANGVTGWDTANTKSIVVTAYAIQKQGFEENVAGAWAAVQQAYTST